MSGLNLDSVETPAAVVRLDRLKANIRGMAELARSRGLKLRPHTKTHRSPDIGRLQIAAGATGLTVARLVEAATMAADGMDDLFLAYPVVGPAKLQRLEQLARYSRVAVGLDSQEAAEGVARVGQRLGHPIPVYLEVDTGYHRCGTLPGTPTVNLAQQIAGYPGLTLHGLFTHMGQVYDPHGKNRRLTLAQQEGELLVETAAAIRRLGFELPEVSIGTTALLPEAAATAGVTEIRPGAYVFQDLSTVLLGIAAREQCALTVLATVISRPSADRAIIDAGHKVLGLATVSGQNGHGAYGEVSTIPDLLFDRIAEEHGILTGPSARLLRVGDRLEILPAHAGSVANLAGALLRVTTDGSVLPLRQVPVGDHR